MTRISRRQQQDVARLVGRPGDDRHHRDLHEAFAAYEERFAGIFARVIDGYSVKPLDTATMCKAATETGWLVVVEDHASSGGLGEEVAAAVGTLAPVHRRPGARRSRRDAGGDR